MSRLEDQPALDRWAMFVGAVVFVATCAGYGTVAAVLVVRALLGAL